MNPEIKKITIKYDQELNRWLYNYIHINTYITYTYCIIMMMMMMILSQNDSLSRPNL